MALRDRPLVKIGLRVGQAVAAGVHEAARRNDTSITPADAPIVAAAVEQRVAPIIANATNSEPWYQSRVKVGLLILFVGWLAQRFGWTLDLNEADKELITNVVMGFGGGMAGAGRWLSGLRPMTWNPLTWFGLKK